MDERQSMSNDDERIEIDLQRKETEAGWIAVLDRFGLRATPQWFNWVGWIFVLGFLHFLYVKSLSVVFAAMLVLSYGLLWFYFMGFFYRLKIKGIPFVSNRRVARLISIVISGSLAFSAWTVATFVAREIARFQQSG